MPRQNRPVPLKGLPYAIATTGPPAPLTFPANVLYLFQHLPALFDIVNTVAINAFCGVPVGMAKGRRFVGGLVIFGPCPGCARPRLLRNDDK